MNPDDTTLTVTHRLSYAQRVLLRRIRRADGPYLLRGVDFVSARALERKKLVHIDGAYASVAHNGGRSYMWGQDSEGNWWLVECKRGEPRRAYHPLFGEMERVFRDSFVRWHSPPSERWHACKGGD